MPVRRDDRLPIMHVDPDGAIGYLDAGHGQHRAGRAFGLPVAAAVDIADGGMGQIDLVAACKQLLE